MKNSRSPRQIKLINLRNQSVLADRCIVAERFFDRLKGLIGRTSIEVGEGMLFPFCNDIHMWFMKIPIDVVFLKKNVVTSVREKVRPWRLLPLRDGKASETLELPIGTVVRCEIRPGDEVCIIN